MPGVEGGLVVEIAAPLWSVDELDRRCEVPVPEKLSPVGEFAGAATVPDD